MNRVTIKEVAKLANVSIATVSRVINNINTVTSENKEKVNAAIEELNYFSNKTAANLKKNSSNIIGIIIPTLANEFFMQLIKGIEDHFNRSDYVFYIASSDDNPQKEESILRKLYESNAEIIVLATIGYNESFIKELVKMGTKIITVDRLIDIKPRIDFVGESNNKSAYELTIKFLETTTVKEIALLGGYEYLSIGYERIQGVKKALGEKNIPFHYYDGQYNEKNAKKIFSKIRTDFPNGCGIISLSNTMTSGIITEMYENFSDKDRVLYPIASYGQITFQQIFSKNIITFVKQNPYELGIEVASLLQEKLEITDSNTVVTKILTNIIE
ncbi:MULTISPECIES: LacI family DNA-binding transcriptional regulator [Enterococcus]|uniref:LacI family DNA-binding transcriptional regulator n=1 Tax=Enterococcus TaxID=1350 RepID=UPI0013752CB8|nr:MULTISPECIES: LacI family DNA-binding transcriptional regulator [Enterococcus]KAF1302630.1 hypothetical protein BAU16_06195 [Enterococcus sp. JM9B]